MTMALLLPDRGIHHPEISMPASREWKRTSRYSRSNDAGVEEKYVLRFGCAHVLAARTPTARYRTVANTTPPIQIAAALVIDSESLCRAWLCAMPRHLSRSP